ncbi:hypothetical protein [Halorhodospira sp. 9622]|uniref:hypothetical protein n=1 Tax=Halorhodospira sp. 9622 TaxID=2899136 RepID=UPI001EE963AB|nr:hypothetical protein [Halorhodospira sp. 9622]MCG5538303.1 hypothetical protein [Halorhodospira sp. 9622]
MRTAPRNLFVAAALTLSAVTTAGAGEQAVDSPETLAEHLAVMNALTVKGRTMRDSEMGHPAYDDTLSGSPMGAVGERWLALLEALDASYCEGAEEGLRGAEPRHYADATYLYHMHHSAGRFEEHGLFDPITHAPSALLVDNGRFVMESLQEGGRFHTDAGQGTWTPQSMAYGLDAFHGVAYAWVRWKKPGGADDMGLLSAEQMREWFGHEVPEALMVARDAAQVLDEAWDTGAGTYDLGDGPVWELDALGSLIRGHKGLYELLYVFGDEEDQRQAERLFERAARLVEAVLGEDGVAEPWGLPARVRFEDGHALADSDRVDVQAQWRWVHHLTGGFALLRENEGTSRFLERRRPGLSEEIGAVIDRLIEGALVHQLIDGRVVASLDYTSGEVRDRDASVETRAALVMGLGNGYAAGESFPGPGDWEEADAQAEERTRAVYDVILGHGRGLSGSMTETR